MEPVDPSSEIRPTASLRSQQNVDGPRDERIDRALVVGASLALAAERRSAEVLGRERLALVEEGDESVDQRVDLAGVVAAPRPTGARKRSPRGRRNLG